MIIRNSPAKAQAISDILGNSQPLSGDTTFRILSNSLNQDIEVQNLRRELHRKNMQCRILHQQLDNCILRQHVLEKQLEKALGNKQGTNTQTIDIGRQRQEGQTVKQLKEQLRFYKDSLVKKSFMFQKMEDMLQENQQTMATLAGKNRHLQELVSHQKRLIKELYAKGNRKTRDKSI